MLNIEGVALHRVLLISAVLLSCSMCASALRINRQDEFWYAECPHEKTRGCCGKCAHTGACKVDLGTGTETCTEPVLGCKQGIQYVDGLALLFRNTHYRISDVLFGVGPNYRASRLAILINPLFRGTMLRDVLGLRTTINGTKLHEIAKDEADLERIVRLESVLETNVLGSFCNTKLHKGAAHVFGFPTREDLETAVAGWINDKLVRGECDEAAPDELVVQIRMGDKYEDTATIIDNVDKALQEKPFIKSILFSGVMHFSGELGKHTDGRVKSIHDTRVQNSVNSTNNLMTHYNEKGFQTRMRSQPLADDDLCYLSRVPNLLQSCGTTGWCAVIKNLRNRCCHGKLFRTQQPLGEEAHSPKKLSESDGVEWLLW